MKISGGTVTATGTGNANGIGWGDSGFATNITIDGPTVVVKAQSGNNTASVVPALPPNTSLQQGIVYTAPGNTGVWTGSLYGNVELNQDLYIPSNLTVPVGQILAVASGVQVTLSEATGAKYTIEGEMQNKGTLSLPTDIVFANNGKLTTLLAYDAQGGSFDDVSDSYQVYQDESGTGKKYQNLPQPVTNATFGGWFTETAGRGEEITSTSDVQLNLHQVYADMVYTVAFDSQGGSSVAPVTDVIYDATIAEPSTEPTKAGYTFDGWYKEAACTNKWDFAKDSVQGDTTLYAGWIADGPTPPDPGPGPEPTPTPEPTPATDGSDILPVTGDTTQSVGLFVLAAAVTGIVLALLGGFYTLAQKRDA